MAVLNLSNKMPAEGESDDVEMESENGEEGVVSSKVKYRELKGRLKYLVYEQESFQNEIQKAQTKLLQLSRDKSFLLDQLMRYEAVVVSDDDITDYSASEDESILQIEPSTTLTQSHKTDGTPKSQPAAKLPAAPKSVTIVPSLTKQGITKAAALLNATAAAVKVAAKSGTKRQVKAGGAGTKLSTTQTARVAKTVARARSGPTTSVQGSPHPPAPSPLVVSLPLNLTNLRQRNEQPPNLSAQLGAPQGGTATSANATCVTGPPPLSRPLSSSSSSSSTSSSSSDSNDSGSESSASSGDEPMESGGPVPMVTSVTTKGTTQLLRPKAITSPVKVPPQLIQAIGSSSTTSTPPTFHSPLQSPPGQLSSFSWTNRHGDSLSTTGFVPIAPPLSSPPSVLPFSSFVKPSAFQVIDPKPPHQNLQDSNQQQHTS